MINNMRKINVFFINITLKCVSNGYPDYGNIRSKKELIKRAFKSSFFMIIVCINKILCSLKNWIILPLIISINILLFKNQRVTGI